MLKQVATTLLFMSMCQNAFAKQDDMLLSFEYPGCEYEFVFSKISTIMVSNTYSASKGVYAKFNDKEDKLLYGRLYENSYFYKDLVRLAIGARTFKKPVAICYDKTDHTIYQIG
ncbi:hypothetical protein [Serratia surfactantfaciens]|uniref:hypothetical protein n=1 Tax=Serratia surfactantfaciens TaxID=2741499 RepID=UPI001B3C98CF|nr:hypothetical protein [Serratia surfactantfaciens]